MPDSVEGSREVKGCKESARGRLARVKGVANRLGKAKYLFGGGPSRSETCLERRD